jgi:hypothetical protein
MIDNTRYLTRLLEPFGERPFELEEDGTALCKMKMLFDGEVDLSGYIHTP